MRTKLLTILVFLFSGLAGISARAQDSGEWAPVRIRVAGNRKQVWLNNRVYADDVLEMAFAAGNLTCSQDLRNIRIRNLHLDQQ